MRSADTSRSSEHSYNQKKEEKKEKKEEDTKEVRRFTDLTEATSRTQQGNTARGLGHQQLESPKAQRLELCGAGVKTCTADTALGPSRIGSAKVTALGARRSRHEDPHR